MWFESHCQTSLSASGKQHCDEVHTLGSPTNSASWSKLAPQFFDLTVKALHEMLPWMHRVVLLTHLHPSSRLC